jgi:hypothetical protein
MILYEITGNDIKGSRVKRESVGGTNMLKCGNNFLLTKVLTSNIVLTIR